MSAIADIETQKPGKEIVLVPQGDTNAGIANLTTGYANRQITEAEKLRIQFHLSNARSKNTNLAYQTQWKLFVKWCAGQTFVPFPAEVDVVVLYLNHLSEEGWKRSKIEQAISAIKACHADNVDLLPPGNSDIAGRIFQHPKIRSTLASIRRTQVEKGLNSVSKPRSFSQDEILSMAQSFPQTPAGVMERAILLLGVNTGMRASEICSLQVHDVVLDEVGMDLQISSSKTDQFGEGSQVYVTRLAPSLRSFDAVTAMEAWLEQRRSITPEGTEPLFLAFRKGGSSLHLKDGAPHQLTRLTISSIVQRSAVRAGITVNDASISSHSLRHSFITNAFSRGLSSHMIAKTSRHKSMSVLAGYDQSSRREQSVSGRLWG